MSSTTSTLSPEISPYRWFPEVIVALETAHYEQVDNMLLLLGLERSPDRSRYAKTFTISRIGGVYSPSRIVSPTSSLQKWASEAILLVEVLKQFDSQRRNL